MFRTHTPAQVNKQAQTTNFYNLSKGKMKRFKPQCTISISSSQNPKLSKADHITECANLNQRRNTQNRKRKRAESYRPEDDQNDTGDHRLFRNNVKRKPTKKKCNGLLNCSLN